MGYTTKKRIQGMKDRWTGPTFCLVLWVVKVENMSIIRQEWGGMPKECDDTWE